MTELDELYNEFAIILEYTDRQQKILNEIIKYQNERKKLLKKIIREVEKITKTLKDINKGD